MHVVDEILSYRQLAESGMAPETIAARFGQSVITVRQRLKLAHLSPKLLDVMRGDGLTIEQARALALSDSHEEQEGVWFGLPDWNREPRSIRAMLTHEHVRSSDRLARFVGLDAYEAAGGAVLRDLFAEDSGTFLTDRALLTQLATDALEQAAVPLRAEGWKWVETALDTSAMFNSGHGRIYPQERSQTEDGEAGPSALAYDPQEMALAGCIVAIDHGGALHIARGYVKAEDRDALEQSRRGEAAEGPDDGEGEEVVAAAAPDAAYSAALVEELTAIRTAAMRVELANRPAVALAALLYPLVSRIFHDAYLSFGTAYAVEVSGQRRDLAGSIKESGEVRALAAWEAMKEAWGEQLPGASADLWAWLLEQPMDRLVDLLAFVTAANLNGVKTKHDHSGSRLANIEQIAMAVGLDMHQHWEPQAVFLSRLSKVQIAEVLCEAGCTPQVVRAVEMAPKAEAVAEAEKLLEGTGWLPTLLQAAAAA
ncbi:ParB/RepB/Spo0J family partition protein [Ensifer adhaerens]|uniref:ParB/RepB/Spo0J family partition protein n=1 Tax=Ensifer adhaerens TaxID=106592 RepID=UPI0018F862D0|nr:plasmid stabilization protein [Ensifer adhaerens]